MKGKKAQRQQSRLLENRAQQKRTIDRCYYGTIRAELHKQPPPFSYFCALGLNCLTTAPPEKKPHTSVEFPFYSPDSQRWFNGLVTGFTLVLERNRRNYLLRSSLARLESCELSFSNCSKVPALGVKGSATSCPVLSHGIETRHLTVLHHWEGSDGAGSGLSLPSPVPSLRPSPGEGST